MFSTNARFTPSSPQLEIRLNELIAKLSLEEKIDLLGGHPTEGCTNANEKIGLPPIKMADGPAGVHWWCKSSTAYPVSIALAASFDRELMYRVGEALGRDCRARGIHILLAPGVNIYRSALCGRNFEYLGEDPYLSARMVAEQIKGLQSKGVAATVKHYAVNNQEYDRHQVSSDLDERTLHEVYLPAFKAAIVDAGAGCLMTGYNPVNGVHCSEHEYLINTVLKGAWSFDGLVMSDWVSTYSALAATVGGLDLEMPKAVWFTRERLVPLVKEGIIPEALIDDKVRRLLRLAHCFGWMDAEQTDAAIPLVDPVAHATALDAARAGCVLLKNDNQFLPLDRTKVKTVAVVGFSAANANICGGGSAWSTPNHLVTFLDGISASAGESVEVIHAPGPGLARERVCYARGGFVAPDGTAGLKAEIFSSSNFENAPAVVRTDKTIDFHWGPKPPAEGVNPNQYAIRWTGSIVPEVSGEYVFYVKGHDIRYRLLLDGVVVSDYWKIDRNGTSQLQIQLKKSQPCTVLLEAYNSRSWVGMHLGYELLSTAQNELAQAVETVRGADAAIVCTGFDKDTEGEGYDRPFALDSMQEKLICECAQANPNTAVVLAAGGNVDMSNWLGAIKSLLMVWYPGQEGGSAIGEILFGDCNPCGKLPATFETRLEDRSSFDCYHDSDNDQRITLTDGIFGGYRHFDRTGIAPRFAFGFGLSYTTFSLSNLRLSAKEMREQDTITVCVDITNTGARGGAEVVQLYIGDQDSSLPRPIKELKGFAKVFLAPGQSKTAEMTIDRSSLVFYDMLKHDWVYEPGAFLVFVGTCAADCPLKALLLAQ